MTIPRIRKFNWNSQKYSAIILIGTILFEFICILEASKAPTSSFSMRKSGKSYKVHGSSIPEEQQLPHQQKGDGGDGKGIPKIVKIFENPTPNDGYESLREFSNKITKGMFRTQLYNTSIALTSAIFSFQLPGGYSDEATTVNMANQTIFGLFAMMTAVLIFALPVLLTGQKFNPEARSNEDSGIISQILKTQPLARIIETGVHKKIGLEPEKCLQKTICEAHRFPQNKRYGMLAIPFQIFYPPMSIDKNTQARSTSFQDAAYTGKYEKTRCEKKYNCFFDVLDLGRYLLDWYQYHNGGVDSS